MQPTYFPWLGHFDLIDQVDKFIFLDNVQLIKRAWGVRNRIKTAQGELFLTIPVKKTKHRDETLYHAAVINDSESWKRKHLKSIELSYKKAIFFEEVYPFLESLIMREISHLSDFNIYINSTISKKLGIQVEFLKATELQGLGGHKDALLASICKSVACDTYISQQGSANYIEANSPGGEFIKQQINLYYHNYEHPIYSQLHGNFRPYMSIIDLLFNIGFKKGLSTICSGRRLPIDYLSFRETFLDSEN